MQVVIVKNVPTIKLTNSEQQKLRDAQAICDQLARYPELYPDARDAADNLSKTISPELITEGE